MILLGKDTAGSRFHQSLKIHIFLDLYQNFISQRIAQPQPLCALSRKKVWI